MAKIKVNQCMLLVVCGGILLGGLGCATKAGPAQSTGFIKADMMSKYDDLPFHSAWRKPGVAWEQYARIYIAPVDMGYLHQTSDWAEDLEDNEQFSKDIEKLALHTEEIFRKKFEKDPQHRFHVASQPISQTLVMELALTEVVPGKVVLGALGFAPFGVGTVMKLYKRKTGNLSTVAFEARLKDGETGDVLAMFADREAEKSSLVNMNDITWYGHAHGIVNEWADQFVQIFNQGPDEVIKDSKPFTFKPW